MIGLGFENETINKIVISKDVVGKDITVGRLLTETAISIAYFNGFYWHTNLNRAGEVVSVKLIPFKYCRFGKIDDTGYTAKIAVYDNWDKDRNKNYNKNKIAWYNIWNANVNVIIEQINAVKDIKNYKGQIYHYFYDTTYLYPLSPIDSVYLDADTEYQLTLYRNRITRNGMINKAVFRIQPPINDTERKELIDRIKSFIGVDGDNVLVLEDEIDRDTNEIKKTGAFAIDKIDSTIDSKLFEGWEKTLMNNLRKAYSALPAILIDYEESKLGTTSGEAIIQATNFYNAVTADDRDLLSECFKEVFSRCNIPELKNNDNWGIKPINLYGTN